MTLIPFKKKATYQFYFICETLLRVAFITLERIVGKICFLKSAKPQSILLLQTGLFLAV